MVAMSQESSEPQAVKFLSQVLMPDRANAAKFVIKQTKHRRHRLCVPHGAAPLGADGHMFQRSTDLQVSAESGVADRVSTVGTVL